MTTARAELDYHLRQVSPFLEKLARLGFAAKGVVYVMVGGLAAMASAGTGGHTVGSQGAFRTLLQQPFGQILLGTVSLGLLGYAMFQFIRAVEDPEGSRADGKRLLMRVGFFISGLIHLGLVLAAVELIRGSAAGDDSGDSGARDWTAKLMRYPAGEWLAIVVGLAIAGVGVWQLYRAYCLNLDRQLDLSPMDPDARRWTIRLGRTGIAARGVVFTVVGCFLVVAGWHHNPNEAKGIGGALAVLARQPYGPWLLGAVALGLVAYGVFEFVRARYRRIAVQ